MDDTKQGDSIRTNASGMEVLHVERRLTALETTAKDHGRIITEFGILHQRLGERVDNVDAILQKRAIDDARREEREKQYQKNMEEMSKDISAIRKTFSKLAWIVAGVVVAAAVTWVLRGNLMP